MPAGEVMKTLVRRNCGVRPAALPLRGVRCSFCVLLSVLILHIGLPGLRALPIQRARTAFPSVHDAQSLGANALRQVPARGCHVTTDRATLQIFDRLPGDLFTRGVALARHWMSELGVALGFVLALDVQHSPRAPPRCLS